MTQEEIIAGNKLIAEFMGELHKSGFINVFAPKIENLKENLYVVKSEPGERSLFYLGLAKYHESWDWLMPVVEKIEQMGFETEITCGIETINDDRAYEFYHEACISDLSGSIVEDGIGKSKIEAVWKTVVQFIKFHNEHGK